MGDAAIEHIRVIPCKIKIHDEQSGCDRLRGIGFRAVSSSGWEGPLRQSRPDAVEDARARRTALTPYGAKG